MTTIVPDTFMIPGFVKRAVKTIALLLLVHTCSPGYGAAQDTAVPMSDMQFQKLLDSTRTNMSGMYKGVNHLYYSVHAKAYAYFGFRPLAISLVPLLEEYHAHGYWFSPDSVQMQVFAHRVVVPDDEDMKADSLFNFFGTPNPMRFNYSAFPIESQRKIAADSSGENVTADTLRPPTDSVSVTIDTDAGVAVRVEKRDDDTVPMPLLSDADSIYYYEHKGFVDMGTIRAAAIAVSVRDEKRPGVFGTLWVDEFRFVVVRADLQYNHAALDLSPRLGEAYRRVTFNRDLYYGRYWLPDVVDEEIDIKIFGINVRVQRTLRYSDYRIEENPTEEFHQAKAVTFAIDSGAQQSLFGPPEYANMITPEEEERILEYFEDQFYSANLLPGMEDMESIARQALRRQVESIGGKPLRIGLGLSRFLQYNRVEGPRLNLGWRWAGILPGKNAVNTEIGYGFEDYRWKGKLEFLQWFGKEHSWFWGFSVFDTYAHDENEEPVGVLANSLASFLGKSDFYDLYRTRGAWLGGGWQPVRDFGLAFRLYREDQRSVAVNTGFSLFRRGTAFRANPPILDGTNQAAVFSMDYSPGRFSAKVNFEKGWDGDTGGDFKYSRLWLDLLASKRLFRPLRLNTHVQAGIADNTVPPQKMFDFGGTAVSYFHPVLRGLTYHAYTGNRMAQAICEFELNGRYLRTFHIPLILSNSSKLYFWGGAGWSELPKDMPAHYRERYPSTSSEKVYLEAGIGLGSLLNIARTDFIMTNLHGRSAFIRFRFLQ